MSRKAQLIALASSFGVVSILSYMQARKPKPMTSDKRQEIVDIAKAEIGQQDPQKYWEDVIPGVSDFHGAWCGGFTLWALHQAGVAKGVNWTIGKGYCYQLPITTDPQPGDIAYFDQPYQHHAIVVSNENGKLVTVDGNQPGNTVKLRERESDSPTAFYSIEPLLSAA